MRIRPPLFEVIRRVAYWEAPADYIIFKDGDLVMAKNGRTGVIEYSGSELSSVMNNIIEATPDGGSVCIYIKDGDYNVENTISITKNLSIRISGAGSGGTVLHYTGSGGSESNLPYDDSGVNYVIKADALSGSEKGLQKLIIENLTIHINEDTKNDYVGGIHAKYNLIILRNILVFFDTYAEHTFGFHFNTTGCGQGAIIEKTKAFNAVYGHYICMDHAVFLQPITDYCNYGYYFDNMVMNVTVVSPHAVNSRVASYWIQTGYHTQLVVIDPMSEGSSQYDVYVHSIDGTNQNPHSFVKLIGLGGGKNDTLDITFRDPTHRKKFYGIGKPFQNGGVVTFSGDGSTTQFTIAHGLITEPSKVQITPMSADAAGDFYVTKDATNIYVNYTTAPASGTDNIVLSWYAEV